MTNVTTIEELEQAIAEGKYVYKEKEVQRKLRVGTVIDEDKSVKWNAEQVQLHNESVDKERAANRQGRIDLQDQFENDVVHVYSNHSGMSENQVNILYNYAYREKHSSNEVLIFLDELVELVDEVLECE